MVGQQTLDTRSDPAYSSALMKTDSHRKLLVVQVAALGYEFLRRHQGVTWSNMTFHSARTVFPAVTCTVQASFRTAAPPRSHGIVANGLWDPAYRRARFWEQSAALVSGPRIWDEPGSGRHSVGVLFWQQSLGEAADVLLSPAPIHKHHGGMIQDFYSLPAGMYEAFSKTIGRPFDLMRYWGPMASHRSSDWIADATSLVLADPDKAPDLCLTYLPALDYDLQRFGTGHRRSRKALGHVLNQLARLKACAETNGYELLIFGDYAMADVTGEPVYPNLALRQAGLLNVRHVEQMAYPDLYVGPAFVVADHEIGHVYVHAPSDLPRVRTVLEDLPGIDRVLDRGEQAGMGIDHPRAGDLVILAAPGSWIAYPWWNNPVEEPDYARHVDIHNKPGYDPCELFWGWPPGSVSRDARRVRGTHGRNDPGREIAWASTFIDGQPDVLLDLAASVRTWLGGG